MKRTISILLSAALCLIVFLPVTANAQTYDLGDTDMSISVDDTQWYVFTRDNVANNPELAEFDVSEEYMNEFFRNNDVYMQSVLFFENGEFMELFVRRKTLNADIVNLTNCENEKVTDIAKAGAKKVGAETYSIYEKQYKFIRLEYTDANYYLCEFMTIVNKDNYTLTFQSKTPFTDVEYAEIEKIVNSVQFDVDETLEEDNAPPFFETVAGKAVIGGITGGLAGLIFAIVGKKKKKGSEPDQAAPVDNTETN